MLALDTVVQDVPIHNGQWDLSALDAGVGRLATTGEAPQGTLAPALVGHISLASGAHGPFGYLWKMEPGAEVVYLWAGQRYHYTLRDKQFIAPNDTAALYVADGRKLLLVTCDGWDFTHWQYTLRLVFTAELDAVEPLP